MRGMVEPSDVMKATKEIKMMDAEVNCQIISAEQYKKAKKEI
jgi:hypothetical protein